MLEFKRSIPRDLAKSICGMANASGGTILLGIGDDGDIAGIDTSNKTIAKVEDYSNSCDPAVALSVQKLEGCLAVEVRKVQKNLLCAEAVFMSGKAHAL